MWADILTKPLQGPKFCTMCAFLMNCPVDYCKELPFIPSPCPTLAPTNVLTPKLVSLSLPSPNPSEVPMKPQLPLTTPLSWGGVGARPTGTPMSYKSGTPISHKSHKPVSLYSGPPDKKFRWWDTLFPRKPLADADFWSLADLYKFWLTIRKRALACNSINISISNVKSAI